jgi:hypothetical protein
MSKSPFRHHHLPAHSAKPLPSEQPAAVQITTVSIPQTQSLLNKRYPNTAVLNRTSKPNKKSRSSNTNQSRTWSTPFILPQRWYPAFLTHPPSRTSLQISHASIIFLIRFRSSKVPVVPFPSTGPPSRRSKSLPTINGPAPIEGTCGFPSALETVMERVRPRDAPRGYAEGVSLTNRCSMKWILS